MSKLHKALQNSQTQSRRSNHDDFNPLSMDLAPSKPRNRNPLYWLIGAACLVAMFVLVFLPLQPELSTAATESEPNVQRIAPQETANTVDVQDSSNRQGNVVSEQAPAEIAATEVTTKTESVAEMSSDLETPAQETVQTVSKRLTQVEPKPPAVEVDTPASTQPPTSAPMQTEAQPSKTATKSASQPTAASNSNTVITTSRGIWLPKVEAAIEAGELEVAESLLKQWLASTTDDETPRLWLARLYFNSGFYAAAEPLIEPLASADALALQGLIYEKTGRYSEAASRFEQLFRNDPGNAQWLLLWAINAENDGQRQIAVTLYQTFVNQFRFEDENWLAFAQQRLFELGG